MAYQKNSLAPIVESDPQRAAAEMLRAYKDAGANQRAAAKNLGIHEITFIRYVRKLEEAGTHLGSKLSGVRLAARAAGKLFVAPARERRCRTCRGKGHDSRTCSRREKAA